MEGDTAAVVARPRAGAGDEQVQVGITISRSETAVFPASLEIRRDVPLGDEAGEG